MNIAATIELFAGGPGSGCNPDKGKCGRPRKKKRESLQIPKPPRKPKLLYHGTSVAQARKIMKQGIHPDKPSYWAQDPLAKGHLEGRVFATTSLERARWYGWTRSKGFKDRGPKWREYAVVEIRLPKSVFRKLQTDIMDLQGGLVHDGAILPSYIKKVYVYRGNDRNTEPVVKVLMKKGKIRTFIQGEDEKYITLYVPMGR